jgi:hypothetical protein
MAGEMIERIAKAMFVDASTNGYPEQTWSEIVAMPQHSTTVSFYRNKARIAIAAMREPTQDMITAKKAEDAVHWDYSCQICGGAKFAWQTMIDAALSDD